MNKLLTFLIFLAVFTSGCKKETGDKSKITISGTSYPTVVIGRQEWTTVNYNGPGGLQGEFFGPDDNFNKFYTVEEAIKIRLPSGWRVPTKDDFNTLIGHFSSAKDKDGNFVGDINVAKALMSTDGWDNTGQEENRGTNSSGFNAYPAGFYIENPLYNEWVTTSAWFLTSTPLPKKKVTSHSTNYAFIITNLWLNVSVDNVTTCFACLPGVYNTNNAKSLRFVRNL
ncbi:FISUMP domain-containing protein [Mucilaginibacter sp. AK015]|uniref:FISUMP domain-containing protein n=1 Tax=Mucilaginibacter sp. AK015 TaxID=2723072 RepID=UPI00161A9F81|nr:FISUMP domain-containing protein [Mucilaginibacter sp. AK015]MBB5397433.1 uncharacterized protein (TIGR02145 family) [Mucilaginibacter sp. AK015]